MNIKRYTWEDALIDAQTAGVLPNGALLVALKLAKAITWEPADGRPSGLYWKNEDALESVGCGRSTYFKHRSELFEAGFLTEVKDSKARANLVPAIPEAIEDTTTEEKSTVETDSVHSRDYSSPHRGLKESTGDNPYSVDIQCRDTVEDTVERKSPVADAPVDITNPLNYEVKEIQAFDSLNLYLQDTATSLNSEEETPESTVETNGLEDFRYNGTMYPTKAAAAEARRRDELYAVWAS